MAMEVGEESKDTAVQIPNESEKISRKSKFLIAFAIAVSLSIVLVLSSNWISKTTGYGVLEQDEYALAECLTYNGVQVFGNINDEYTLEQINLFGHSFDNLDYVECSENKDLCSKLTGLPAWKIKEEISYGIKSLEELSQLSGC